MGYYTNYTLEVIEGPQIVKMSVALVPEAFKRQIGEYAAGALEDDCKWYEHDKDMIKFSKLWPDHVFQLSGIGEEQGDVWVKYYKNGKMHMETVKVLELPGFDPKKLKDLDPNE